MKTDKIMNYLDTLFPDPKCELIYNNDYELLIAIVLSAQTTDKRVNSVTPILFNKYNNLNKLKEADLRDLEDILRPIGSFRKKASYIKDIATILVDEYDGIVPRDKCLLEKFPGVGRKTANVFLSEYYKEPHIGVDTHVERVSKRLKLAYSNDSVVDVEKKLMKKFPKDKWANLHLQLVLFGRYHCLARNPNCNKCKLNEICKYGRKL